MRLWISALAFVDEPGKQGSFYSPVIRVVPDKGFILINSGNGILWVKASKAAMPHLSKLPVGGLIDIQAINGNICLRTHPNLTDGINCDLAFGRNTDVFGTIQNNPAVA